VEPNFHIALICPEIAPNTGNAGRLCLAVGARLHLVHPLGFQTDEKAVRRAGLDYWKQVDVVEHASAEAFWAWVGDRPAHLFSSHGATVFTAAPFARGDVLVFGRESVGLPRVWVTARGGYSIPMVGPTRSLNLSNAVSVVAYAALARIEPRLFGG
jgi:tRNA (cytidine/uridine-2'-O-)-methyltransferase